MILQFVVVILILFFYKLLFELYLYYKNQRNPLIQKIKNDLKHLSPVANNLTIYEGDQSYTYNKRRIYLCLYDSKGKQYPYDSLIYVAIHELSHVLCEETGHTTKFWEINDNLLQEAKSKGIYNGSIMQRDYCPLY